MNKKLRIFSTNSKKLISLKYGRGKVWNKPLRSNKNNVSDKQLNRGKKTN